MKDFMNKFLMKSKVLSKEEAIENGEFIMSYDWNKEAYIYKDGVYKHLIINGERKIVGKNVEYFKNGDYLLTDLDGEQSLYRNEVLFVSGTGITSFENGDYSINVTEKIVYLIREKKIIAFGKWVYSYPNNFFAYRDFKGVEHLCKANGKPLKKGHRVFMYPDNTIEVFDVYGHSKTYDINGKLLKKTQG